MTPALLAELTEARVLLLAAASLAEFAPAEKRASHLAARCTDMAERLARHTPKEEEGSS